MKLIDKAVYVIDGQSYVTADNREELNHQLGQLGKTAVTEGEFAEAGKETLAWGIIEKHNTSNSMDKLRLKFDSLASHDITYVGIIQTARASGLTEFPVPYALTNCHNSLCAVGGTINEDDHVFGLSAAKKYGGLFVPAHQAVIHQYVREEMAGCGRMILGSDSHTRYGALGTMGVGEGGPELVKQILNKTYDINYPDVVAIYLKGSPKPGVGPQDVSLAIIGALFKSGFVKNKVMEFVGPGIAGLSVDYRMGIDVMTTETTCLSSIWMTDDVIKKFYAIHGRPDAYKPMQPGRVARYDGLVEVDLSAIEPMIALPFHPSNTYTVTELNANLDDILAKVEAEGQKQLDHPAARLTLRDKIVNGKLLCNQGIIAGCDGGLFENIMVATAILDGKTIGNDEFALSVYPASQPIFAQMMKNGAAAALLECGVTVKTAFCGPCFGAGDVPANNAFSIRHTTRNFPNREGSKPGAGQISSVALMDARSIAATAINGGYLTPATEIEIPAYDTEYVYSKAIYEKRVYNGFGKAEPDTVLKYGPNIADWPEMKALTDDLLLEVVTVITDPVTTTDELIPSGETSSYRSNPMKLAEFTLSRKDPGYVDRAKAVAAVEAKRRKGEYDDALINVLRKVKPDADAAALLQKTGMGSVVYAIKPGDGSAREQAASCQKVLGGWANIAVDYATKRYRSNLINWGMLPFTLPSDEIPFEVGSVLYIEGIRKAVENKDATITAQAVNKDSIVSFTLTLPVLTEDEREIILAGSLINYYGKDLTK